MVAHAVVGPVWTIFRFADTLGSNARPRKLHNCIFGSTLDVHVSTENLQEIELQSFAIWPYSHAKNALTHHLLALNTVSVETCPDMAYHLRRVFLRVCSDAAEDARHRTG